MDRRTALTLAFAAPWQRALFAQPNSRIYSRCLPAYLAGLAHTAHAKREAALRAIQTRAQLEKRQAWVTETLWNLVGGKPAITPLHVERRDAFVREGYRVQHLSFTSQPGIRVPANLYLPTGSDQPGAALPGILFQMGHSLNGKAAEPYQKCCQGLAKLGFVVLAFDPMGQGERTFYHVDDADEEHSRAGRQMLLLGDTMTRLQLWDAVRALEVLASLPMVDPQRLASTGQSGGATLTMLLAAVDTRLRCAAFTCGNTENFALQPFHSPGSTDDAEQNLIAAGPLGFDRLDLLYPLIPKPLLVLASKRDSFGTYSPDYTRSGEAEFAHLRRFYALAGKPGLVDWKTVGLPHSLSRPLRVALYNFFRQHLQGKTTPVAEPALQPEKDETLLVGTKVERTPLPLPVRPPASAERHRQQLVQLLSLGPRSAGRLVHFSQEDSEGCTLATVEVASEAGVYLPGYLYSPLKPQQPGTLLLVEPAGRTRHWREGELYARLGQQLRLAVFDLRGIGDLRPEAGQGNPGYTVRHTTEEHYAWASLMLGRPLLGQRVNDLMAILEALRNNPASSGGPLYLAAAGSLALPALIATALSPHVTKAQITRGLLTWQSYLETDQYTESFANVLPKALQHLDLPDIAALSGPTRLRFGAPLRADGKAATPVEFRQAYGPAFSLLPGPGWDDATLLAWE